MLNAEQIDALAREVQAGKMASFDTIVKETLPVLRSTVHFLISDNELADDVVQESYILIFQEIGRYTPGTNFLAWAKAIARIQALSARFRRQRKAAAAERYRREVLDLVTQDDGEASELGATTEEQMHRLRKCLGSLQEKARTLVERRYFQRSPMEVVARELGMKVGAVTVSLHRIRAALLKCMETDGVRT